MKVDELPELVYELLGWLSHRSSDATIWRDELPQKYDAALAVAVATNPPLVIVEGIGRSWVWLTQEGVGELALYELRMAAGPSSSGDEPAEPGYLDLLVDEQRGEVRRKGFNHPSSDRPRVVQFEADSDEFRTFLAAWHAGERGATDPEWMRGYQGDKRQRRKTKGRAHDKLMPLKVGFEKGSLKLIPL